MLRLSLPFGKYIFFRRWLCPYTGIELKLAILLSVQLSVMYCNQQEALARWFSSSVNSDSQNLTIQFIIQLLGFPFFSPHLSFSDTS